MSFRTSPLHNPEILKLICENLTSEKPTLARLARTSKIFEEPALNVLWYELGGFNHLVQCLPSDLWGIEGEENNALLLVLKKPLISMESCNRLLLHARRVRNFTDYTEAAWGRNVDKSIYDALQLVTQGEKIFPNIRQLAWDCNNISLQFIHMFMGPSLKNVRFTFSPQSLTQISFITVLSERYPALTDVDLCLSPASDESADIRQQAAELTTSTVHKWNNLRALYVNRLSYSTLSNLSLLPHLEVLHADECDFDVAYLPSTLSGGFPVLAELALIGCHNVSDFISALNLMDCSPVKRIYLKFRGIETSATWEDVFRKMAKHLCHESLTQIDLHDGTERSNDIITSNHNQKIQFGALKPLFVFLNLQSVLIEFTRGIQISSRNMVSDMLSSWKHVEELHVKMSTFARCKKRDTRVITLQDFVSIAGRCKMLVGLGIAFDATSPTEIDRSDYPDINESAMRLEELYVGDSPIQKPILVAATLSAAFPSLQYLITIEDEEDLERPRNGEPHGSNHGTWKKAEKMLRIISHIRSQERRYAQHVYKPVSDSDSSEEDEDDAMSEGEVEDSKGECSKRVDSEGQLSSEGEDSEGNLSGEGKELESIKGSRDSVGGNSVLAHCIKLEEVSLDVQVNESYGPTDNYDRQSGELF